MGSLAFTAGTLLSLLISVVVVALPIKIGAHLVTAERRGILWCVLAAIIGVMAGTLAAVIFGGLMGGTLAAAAGFVLAIRFMLGTTVLGALCVALVALGVTLLCMILLLRHGAPAGGIPT